MTKKDKPPLPENLHFGLLVRKFEKSLKSKIPEFYPENKAFATDTQGNPKLIQRGQLTVFNLLLGCIIYPLRNDAGSAKVKYYSKSVVSQICNLKKDVKFDAFVAQKNLDAAVLYESRDFFKKYVAKYLLPDTGEPLCRELYTLMLNSELDDETIDRLKASYHRSQSEFCSLPAVSI